DSTRGNEVSRQALELSAGIDDPLLAAHMRLTIASFRLFYDAWREEDAEVCGPAQETIRRLSGSTIVRDVFYIYVLAFQGSYQEALRQADGLLEATTNPTVFLVASGAKGLIFLLWGR